ncbi:MAG: hypothetical protein Q9167_006218 [Letrouitia subvulpina]
MAFDGNNGATDGEGDSEKQRQITLQDGPAQDHAVESPDGGFAAWMMIFLAQGLCIGIGSGMIFVPGVSIVAKAFTERRPIAVGTCVSASGIAPQIARLRRSTKTEDSLGGIIYPILFQQLQPRIGFPWAVRAIGLLALMTFLASFTVLRNHKSTGTKPRALVDMTAFHELPFMLYMIALTVRCAGYWVPFFYISTFATAHLHTSPEVGFYVLAVTNAGGFFGRLIPGFLPKVLASVEVLPLATAAAGLVTLAWISIHNLGGFIVFCIIYGTLSGISITMLTLMVPLLSPPGAVHDTIGTRLGMAYCACGVGILFGSPIAGALTDLGAGDFTRAQAFAGAMHLGAVALLGYPWYVVKKRAMQEA